MKVLCSEGIANHTGPESCVVHREVHGEALRGESVDHHKEARPIAYERQQSEHVRWPVGVDLPRQEKEPANSQKLR